MTNLLLNLLIQGPQGPGEPAGLQLPNAASTFATGHDGLFYFVYWVCVFFFVLITGILLYSVVKYRRRTPDQAPASNVTHNTALEVTWTVIPLIIVMVIFAWGWKDAKDMTLAPANAHQFEVNGMRWKWSFKHPGATTWAPKVYVPVDEPCQFTMSSKDVLHSFYIPAFRVKRDVLPGRYQTIWFEATHTGTFDIYCTEYCGDQHSRMLAQIVVESKEDWYKRKRDKAWTNLPSDPVAAGEVLLANNGCGACHSVDGTHGTGPSFKGIWGKQEKLADGSTALVDAAYIKESIRSPQAKIVANVPGKPAYGAMVPYNESALPDEHIDMIVEYIKSLK